jgi:hypothetical protein
MEGLLGKEIGKRNLTVPGKAYRMSARNVYQVK